MSWYVILIMLICYIVKFILSKGQKFYLLVINFCTYFNLLFEYNIKGLCFKFFEFKPKNMSSNISSN